jgi:hypothetical protein
MIGERYMVPGMFENTVLQDLEADGLMILKWI